MNYEKQVVENIYGKQTYIIVDNENGTFRSFPEDESNPEYIKFLDSLAVEEATKNAEATVEPAETADPTPAEAKTKSPSTKSKNKK